MNRAHSCWGNGGIRHAGSENDSRDELLPPVIVVFEDYGEPVFCRAAERGGAGLGQPPAAVTSPADAAIYSRR